MVCSGVLSVDAVVRLFLLEVDWVAATTAEVETGGFALMEVKRDGMVTEPEEEDSHGDPGQEGEPGGVMLAGVSGSYGWNISNLSEP